MTAAEYFEKGLKSLYTGDYESALDALSQAIRLDPEFGESYAYRGLAHYKLGNYDAAMAHYDRALELSPTIAGPITFAPLYMGNGRSMSKRSAITLALLN